jgi:hypothetical protein
MWNPFEPCPYEVHTVKFTIFGALRSDMARWLVKANSTIRSLGADNFGVRQPAMIVNIGVGPLR